MNVDVETELEHILAQANILVQDFSPELLGAVGLRQFTLGARKGFHAEREATSECRSKETLAMGPLGVFHVAVKRCHF